jgi:fructokinase
MEPCGSTIEAMLARESGTRLLSFDPNIRASMIPDKERYLERLARLLGMATIVKISEVDLAWIYPGKSTDEAFAALFSLATAGRQAQNPLLAVVTRGHEGAQARLWQAGKVGEVRAAGFSVTVKDTIGAGDTFHAGILAWLEARGLLSREALGSLEPSVLAEGLRYANAAAAITCSRRGAEPPLAAEVKAFLAGHGAA